MQLKKTKDDEHWFSNSSLRELKKLGEVMKMPMTEKHEININATPNSEDEIEDDSQSFMHFANKRMREMINDDSFCGLFTDQEPTEVNAVQGNELVWVCVPVAVDTGSCANVTPPGVFSLEIQESEASKSKTKLWRE